MRFLGIRESSHATLS